MFAVFELTPWVQDVSRVKQKHTPRHRCFLRVRRVVKAVSRNKNEFDGLITCNSPHILCNLFPPPVSGLRLNTCGPRNYRILIPPSPHHHPLQSRGRGRCRPEMFARSPVRAQWREAGEHPPVFRRTRDGPNCENYRLWPSGWWAIDLCYAVLYAVCCCFREVFYAG